jgi:hypothetical protein
MNKLYDPEKPNERRLLIEQYKQEVLDSDIIEAAARFGAVTSGQQVSPLEHLIQTTIHQPEQLAPVVAISRAVETAPIAPVFVPELSGYDDETARRIQEANRALDAAYAPKQEEQRYDPAA